VRQAIAADRRLTGLAVSGGTHPIGPTRERVIQGTQALQYTALAFFAVGDRVAFPVLGMPVPPWYRPIERNRIGYLMATFFAGNMVSANLQKTGAFEVYYNGRPVWSKLSSGQNPNVNAITNALARALQR
jgi:selT/selW/selH-like putative selenoprotein